jgi:hypothetical protein
MENTMTINEAINEFKHNAEFVLVFGAHTNYLQAYKSGRSEFKLTLTLEEAEALNDVRIMVFGLVKEFNPSYDLWNSICYTLMLSKA